MIKVDSHEVEISFPRTPFTEILYKASPKALEKAVISTDLKYIFLAISEKYSVGECADIISKSLEEMLNILDKQEDKNETNSDS